MDEYTSIAYWDNEWDKQKLEYFIEQRINSQIIKILRPILFKGSKVLELGCVPARRLYFLQKAFQVETYGLDYSLNGLFNSVKNNNNLLCADLSNLPFKEGSFDLVYSLGVVEHFSDPTKVIQKHLEMVRRGGFILITVPNFYRFSMLSTIYRLAGRYKQLKQTHNMNIMNLNNFNALFKQFNLEPFISDYYGPLVVYSPPVPFLRRLCARINNFIDRRAIMSRFFSPDLVFISKKNLTDSTFQIQSSFE